MIPDRTEKKCRRKCQPLDGVGNIQVELKPCVPFITWAHFEESMKYARRSVAAKAGGVAKLLCSNTNAEQKQNNLLYTAYSEAV